MNESWEKFIIREIMNSILILLNAKEKLENSQLGLLEKTSAVRNALDKLKERTARIEKQIELFNPKKIN